MIPALTNINTVRRKKIGFYSTVVIAAFILLVLFFYTDNNFQWYGCCTHFLFNTALKDVDIYSIWENETSLPIVAWTGFFSLTIGRVLNDTMVNCSHTCEIVERSAYENSVYKGKIPPAYVIHGAELRMYDLPVRYKQQTVVFLSLEAPPSYNFPLLIPKDYFNATITYRSDSTYPHPYGRFDHRTFSDDSQTIITEEQINDAVKRKNKSCLLLISNCHTNSGRENIVRALSKVINITVAGKCSSMFPDSTQVVCPPNFECENELVASHRFYVAFENSICRDYITEKFHMRASQLLVPIVLHRKPYVDSGIPPSSFVAVDDFNTYQQLAQHLEYLQRNDTAYIEYFEWTKTYRKPWNYDASAGCRLCTDLHRKKKQIVQDIRDFFYSNQCENVI
ncbi:hypothetical protein Q1695_012159 [Nippostrongylus brasiliensis]|nr:hypothetical protein Q1695_012159 [Nippostrongylus brasiliensis]